jgi:AcrR family transcriptional regulator
MAERGRPRGFDRQSALRRAMEVFWDKGYAGASIADLTGAMAIGSPSLYAAFGSKEALFREAVALYQSTEGLEIWDAVRNAATAYQAVEGFLLESAKSFVRPGKPAGCLVVLSALDASEACATVRDDLIRLREEGQEDLAIRLRSARADGEIPAGVDVDAVAAFYIAVQQGMSIQARDGAGADRLRAIARAALAAWGPLVRPEGMGPDA